MTKAWWDNYVGLPFAEKGRTREGTDCWGLVRMVHAEVFGNKLPMLEGDYNNSMDDVHLAEIVAREQENWRQMDLPREGDVVLFHVMGGFHVGVVTAPGRFLHIREKQLSTVESLESPLWKKRFRGCFRYCTETTPIEYSAAAHPLRSQRVEGMLPPGATVSTIVDILKKQQGVADDMPFQATVWIDGRQVDNAMWEHTTPSPGSRIEMRAVARGTDGRAVAGVAIMLIATVLAPYLAPAFSGIATALAPTAAAASNLAINLAFVAITVAGNLLVNAIFPVRQPDDPGQAEKQLLLQGGANRPYPYGTVPVVLGQFRFVAPCAAETYVESNTTVSYLRMAVCWGVGPLQVADYRIGDVPLTSYEEVQVETLTGVAGENKARFNAIYGKDVHQVSPQILLECPEKAVSSVVINTDVYTVTTVGAHGYSTNALVKLTENYDALAPGYGKAIVRVIEEGAITVTGANTFTLPRVKVGVGPMINNGFYVLSITDYTASVPVDWSIYDRYALPENPSAPGAQHIPAAAVSQITLNGFSTTATHTYEIKFYISSLVSGSGFRGYAGGAVGALVTTVGWHTQTIVASGVGGVGVEAAANTSGTIMNFEARRVYTGGIGFTAAGTDVLGSAFSEYVVNAEADQLKVALHFPSGLRSVVKEGGNAGSVDPALFRAVVQYRQLDSNTLAPITAWGDFDKRVASREINLPPAWFNVDNDEALEKVYQWTRITVDEYGHIISRTGAMTTSQFANPAGNLLLRLQQTNFGLNVTFERLPVIPDGEEHLYDICVFGNDVVTTTDQRDGSVTGCGATLSGRKVTIASGDITRAETENIRLGGEGEPYYERKDAFTHNITMDVARGKYEVRIRRTSASNNLFTYPSGNEADRLSDCYLQTITAYSTDRPITPPVPMAMTALRIKATNQINGNIEGLSATVTSICLDYDHVTDTWIERPTRNPASLLRYVLQHPANIKRVADSKLDLPAFVEFHNFCRVNKFMYDALLADKRSVWDVMMDIAAAGRASPTRVDGKHSVVIDKPRTSIVQHFTPHNSWGFESTRALPQHPHAFRVEFNNAEKAYQPDERIVYNDGYSSANATLFETLPLPGVTIPSVIFKHARFHFAQLKLRPEQYILNVDIEHLVCTRGDLVRVTHDVPMWGLGSGRIKNFTVVPTLPENIAQDYKLWTAGMSMPPTGFTLNGLVAENAIVTGPGPGGHNEPLWTCYSNDTDINSGENPDGGFNGNAVTADCSQGHLFAIFVKTYTHTGSTYYGTDQNNNILNLVPAGGAVNTNPYFWGGSDMPAVDTWYLIVGYVHPIGYTGGDVGIAGLYSLAGAKLVDGNEFRFNTGATVARHRAYHFYNPVAAPGTPVQQMSRPVILPCSTADAPMHIERILAHGNGSISLDEPVALAANTDYTMRIRRGDNGDSLTRAIGPKVTAGMYSEVEPTTSVTLNQVEALNLYMLGELDQESVELIVQGIEPSDNLSARVTLVDYSPDVYDSDLEVVPAWDSQITLPPNVLQRTITQKPTITQMRSDEAIMLRNPDGSFNYGLKVSWQNPASLPVRVNGVQAEIDRANDNKERWFAVQTVLMQDRHVEFRDLREGRSYKVRLRYVDENGRVGPWRVSDSHVIVGKTTAPKAVANFTATVDQSGTQIELKWDGNDEIDIRGYEIREANTRWGKDTNYVYRGVATRKVVTAPKVVGASKTWYIRAFDRAGLYSLTVVSVSFTKAALPVPTGLTGTITASSTTVDRVTYNWNDVLPEFNLAYYECILTLPAGGGTRTFKARTSEWTTAFNWTGSATLTVKAVDVHGSLSASATPPAVGLTKLVPNTVGAITADVQRRLITLDWATVAKTTLPVAGYEVRSTDSGFGTTGFLYRGPASNMRAYKMASGVNNFYVRAYDTDGVYSAASSFITRTYAVPPNMTNLILTRKGRYVHFTATGPAQPLDFAYYEFRIKLGGAGGDVWGAYDEAVRSETVKYENWTPTALGTYNVSVRMVDTDGNPSAASFNAAITIAKIPAP